MGCVGVAICIVTSRAVRAASHAVSNLSLRGSHFLNLYYDDSPIVLQNSPNIDNLIFLADKNLKDSKKCELSRLLRDIVSLFGFKSNFDVTFSKHNAKIARSHFTNQALPMITGGGLSITMRRGISGNMLLSVLSVWWALFSLAAFVAGVFDYINYSELSVESPAIVHQYPIEIIFSFDGSYNEAP